MKSRLVLIQQFAVFVVLVAVVASVAWGLTSYPGETFALVMSFVVLFVLWKLAGAVVKDME